MIDTTNYQAPQFWVAYPIGDGSTAHFIRVCEECGRVVKADESIFVNESTGLKDAPNATCKKHGRVKMVFEGFF